VESLLNITMRFVKDHIAIANLFTEMISLQCEGLKYRGFDIESTGDPLSEDYYIYYNGNYAGRVKGKDRIKERIDHMIKNNFEVGPKHYDR